MFEYKIVQSESKSTVYLNGDMDIDVTEIFQEEIAPAMLQYREVEMDFSEVAFVDSSGIGLLIALIKELKERGIKVAITHVSPDVQTVFSLLQLPAILGNDVFDNGIEAGKV